MITIKHCLPYSNFKRYSLLDKLHLLHNWAALNHLCSDGETCIDVNSVLSFTELKQLPHTKISKWGLLSKVHQKAYGRLHWCQALKTFMSSIQDAKINLE